MSEPLKPLYELVREWRVNPFMPSDNCANQLEAQLRAWDEQMAGLWTGKYPKIDQPVSLYVRERLLGVPPKEQA